MTVTTTKLLLHVISKVGLRPSAVGLIVSADRRTPISEVADAIATYQGFEPSTVSVAIHKPNCRGCSPTSPCVEVDPGQTLAGASLVNGTTVTISAGISASPKASQASPAVDAVAQTGPVGLSTAAGQIVVRSGPDAATAHPIELGQEITVGRDRSCDFTLQDPNVGRVHLRVRADAANGQFAIEAVGVDEFPLSVNGQAVTSAEVTVADTIRIGATTLGVQPSLVSRPQNIDTPGIDGRVPFQRTPYYRQPVETVEFEALGVIPDKPEPVRFAYLGMLAPLVMGITMAFLYSPRFLIFAALSPIVGVAGYFEQRRRNGGRYERSLKRFEAKRSQLLIDVKNALETERSLRFASAPDTTEIYERARDRSTQLWVRGPEDEDFLALRLGLAEVSAAIKIRGETRGDDQIRDDLEADLEPLKTLADVPLTINLKQNPTLALVGRKVDTTDLAGALVAQAAGLHTPEELVMAAAVDPSRSLREWFKWLPHFSSATSPLPGPHLGWDRDGADRLLLGLLEVAEARVAQKQNQATQQPWMLVILDVMIAPDAALLTRFLDAAPRANMSALWLSELEDQVPRQAETTVICSPLVNPDPSTVSVTDPRQVSRPLEIERLSAAAAARLARALSGTRDASSATSSSGVPRTVSLYESLGVAEPNAGWVLDCWNATPQLQPDSTTSFSLPLPVGIASTGIAVIDLVAQGPHGLIGGTSGAGKSELLTSMIAGLMVLNPPERANVLFVDYKGGALADLFDGMPHTVGSVTNLDEIRARRALVSLRAELSRRMALMVGKAKDLNEMWDRHPESAPPALVIVIDEFATLVSEVPEFMAGIVDIAQRGRSLGIHLLLATQRPTGAVNENILANTNLRISLRMIDSAESRSVIGSEDAASIPVPLKGRAFMRLGPGQLVAFQAPWSGAPVPTDAETSGVSIDRFEIPAVDGAFRTVEPGGAMSTGLRAVGRSTTPEQNQLAAVLGGIADAARQARSTPGRPPWQPELPLKIRLSDLAQPESDPARQSRDPADSREETDDACFDDIDEPVSELKVAIGLVDDAANQAQHSAVIDLAAGGGLVVIGVGGSGRTTVLSTISAAAAQQPDPPVEYVLDFGSRRLARTTRNPRTAAVATGEDLEAITRIILVLEAELERRRRIQTPQPDDFGVASPTMVAEPDVPILVLIDNYGAAVETFEGSSAGGGLFPWMERLNRILVDGRGVGIYCVLSAGRRASVKTSVLSAITNRVMLRQADHSGYAELGLAGMVSKDRDPPPGRGFVVGTGFPKPIAIQVAMAGGPPQNRSQPPTVQPELQTAPLPDHIYFDPTNDCSVGTRLAPDAVALGIGDITAAVVGVSVSRGPMAVVGPPGSGRSTALMTLAMQLHNQDRLAAIVGPSTSPLGQWAQSMQLSDQTVQLGLASIVAGFLDDLMAATLDHRDKVVIIDDLDILAEQGAVGGREGFDQVSARLSSAGYNWIASLGSGRSYTTNSLVGEARRSRTLLILAPSSRREVQEITGSNVDIRPGIEMIPGRGVLLAAGRGGVVQVATPFVAGSPELSTRLF